MRLSRLHYELLARPESVYQAVLHAIAPLLQVGVLIYLAAVWKSLPDTVPIHYNDVGAIDEFKRSIERSGEVDIADDNRPLLIARTEQRSLEAWNRQIRKATFRRQKVQLLIQDTPLARTIKHLLDTAQGHSRLVTESVAMLAQEFETSVPQRLDR